MSTSIPTPTSTTSTMRKLKSFSILTLDIYGTLIDWETGILNSLQPLLDLLPPTHPLRSQSESPHPPAADDDHLERKKVAIGRAFTAIEGRLQRQRPGMKYSDLLTEAYLEFARELGILGTTDMEGAGEEEEEEEEEEQEGSKSGHRERIRAQARDFGQGIGTWPAFEDTVDAMRRLRSQGFKLAPLSNVDRESFRKTCEGPLRGVEFDAVYTAEAIGSYKPSLDNFRYLLEHVKEDFGLEKEDILHTAQSLTHDHVPAREMGLTSAWIARGPGGKTGMGGDVDKLLGEGKVGFSWQFGSLREMADAVEKEN